MLKFKTSCAVLANLSSNLLNEVGLSLFRYFEVGLRVCDIVVNKYVRYLISWWVLVLVFSEEIRSVRYSNVIVMIIVISNQGRSRISGNPRYLKFSAEITWNFEDFPVQFHRKFPVLFYRTISYKEPKIMLSLYKTLVRPHVEYCSCAWNPHNSKDKELLDTA